MNHQHSQKDKIVRLNGWGSPKVTEGQPKSFACSIIIAELDRRRDFFPLRFVRTCCKKNYSFCNKNYKFPVGESLVKLFKCCAMDVLNVNYFIFSFVSINCEIVLTL